VGCQMV
jgi:hypothetical protein